MPKTSSPSSTGLIRLRHGWQTMRTGVRRWRQRLPVPVKRGLRRITRWSLHSIHGFLIALVLMFVAAYFWLPTLVDRKTEIENYVTSTIGNPVHFDSLDTFWDGLNPGIRVQGFRLQSATTADSAIVLKEVRLSLAWWPLLRGNIRIGSLVLVEPRLAVERLADGELRVTGLAAQDLPDAAQNDFSAWLMLQREMVIENGELHWLDRVPAADGRGRDERMVIQRVNITLRNDGDRHHLDFRAEFPRTVCATCRFTADVVGDPLRTSDWRGTISVQATDLSIPGLPRILRSALPAALDGHFDLQLDSAWRDGRPVLVDGRFAVTDLVLPIPNQPAPVRVRKLDSTLRWKGEPGAWRLELSRAQLGMTQAPWALGRLRIDYQPQSLRVTADHVNLGDVANFAIAQPYTGQAMDWLRAARPQGGLDRLLLELRGDPLLSGTYKVSGDLRRVRFSATGLVPGVRGLSGRLNAGSDGGEFRLTNGESQLHVPRVLRVPIDIRKLTSRIGWQKNKADWMIRAEAIVLSADDLSADGSASLRLFHDPQQSPILTLQLDARDGVGAHAARYLPLIVPDALRTYLEQAIVSGRMTRGSALFEGALYDFPFRNGPGRMEVRAHVEDGVFEYLPGWAPARNLTADLFFSHRGMLITARSGTLSDQQVGRTTVAIADFQDPAGATVTANLRVTGPLNDALRVLIDSKMPRLQRWLSPGMQASGDGDLVLDIQVPTRTPDIITLSGDYRFLRSTVEFPLPGLRAEDITGTIQISESGLQSGRLRARILGGATTLEATPDIKTGDTRVDLQGSITPAGLAKSFGPRAEQWFKGDMPWQARAVLTGTGLDWQFESDWREVDMLLPSPLTKKRGVPFRVRAQTLPGSGADAMIMDVQVDNRVHGRLAFHRGASGWTFNKGRVGIGEKVGLLPDRNGLHLSIQLPALNADAWWSLLAPAPEDPGGDGFDWLQRITAEIGNLEAFGRPLGRVGADLTRWPENWLGSLTGEAAAGQVVLITRRCPGPGDCPPAVRAAAEPPDGKRPGIHLTLQRLALPAAPASGKDQIIHPGRLPALSLKSESFRYADLDLGALEFNAEPDVNGWRISKFMLTQPAARFHADGYWVRDSFGQQSSRFVAELTSRNLGQTLETLGYADEVAGGKLTLNSNWSWRGAPGDLRLPRLNGEMNVRINDGRLPNINPGAGRLLGTLDLRALTRYLSLDFSSVFAKGFTFDNVQGRLVIESGNAYTRDLVIQSPGADIDLVGRIGLAARDLDLEMGVKPRLMSELALTGGLLGGPVVGAAVAVLHTLAKKPFERTTRVNYTVKGPWRDPVVTRLGGAETPTEPEP